MSGHELGIDLAVLSWGDTMFILAITINIALFALAFWGALKVAGVQDHINKPATAGAVATAVCLAGFIPILGPIFAFIGLASLLVRYFDLGLLRTGLVLVLTVVFQVVARIGINLVAH